MDKWQVMTRFVRVAELGSFTKAAEQLGLPKASVSASVAELEQRLGTRLLHRTTRRITLTEDGQDCLDRCRELLAGLDELECQFQRAPAAVNGRIRVDMPARLASYVVIPRLPEFFSLYPNLHVELGSADRRVDLIEEGFDCVVRIGTLADSSLVARKIADIPVVNCVAPNYLAKHGIPNGLADLAHHKLIKYSHRLGARADGFEYVEDATVKVLDMEGVVTVNGTESYLMSCLSALGIAQIPWISVHRLVRESRLKLVLEDYQAEPMCMSLVYPSRRHPAKRVALFMDWLAAILKQEIQSSDSC